MKDDGRSARIVWNSNANPASWRRVVPPADPCSRQREHMEDVENVNPHEGEPKDGFCVSTDPSRLDLALIHDFLANRSYWARGIPLDVVRRSIENSLCFGLYHGQSQIGFARVVTDQ